MKDKLIQKYLEKLEKADKKIPIQVAYIVATKLIAGVIEQAYKELSSKKKYTEQEVKKLLDVINYSFMESMLISLVANLCGANEEVKKDFEGEYVTKPIVDHDNKC